MALSQRTLFFFGCLLVALAIVPALAKQKEDPYKPEKEREEDCSPKYKYKGKWRVGCIMEEWFEPWCATTNNFDKDRKWKACPELPNLAAHADPGYPVVYTIEGGRCMFPFTAFGKTYTNCTTENEATSTAWCSLTADYATDKQFGYCDYARTAGCDYEFTKVVNTIAYDGVKQVGVVTVAACILACQADPACIAFDFNVKTECYLHTNPNEPTYPTTGVDHYIRNPCTTTSAAPTTVTTGVTDATATAVTPACIVTFTKVDGTLSQGGVQQPGVFDEAGCRALCEAADPYCYGFDLSVLGCFLHHNDTVFAIKTQAIGVTQYIRDACTTDTTAVTGTTGLCIDAFTQVNNTLSYNGVLSPSILDVEACKAACVQDPTCLAIDFDELSATLKCFLHSAADYLVNRNTAANGVTQYVKEACVIVVDSTTKPSPTTRVPPIVTTRPTQPGETTTPEASTAPPTTTTPCVESFAEHLGQLSYGGVLAPGVNTVANCQTACLFIAVCLGVDYDVANNECYLHTDPVEFQSVISTTNVNQYQRIRCDGVTVVTTPPTDQTTKPTSELPAECTKKFLLIAVNKHALGGVILDGMRTLPSCQSACASVDSCVAVDYNNGSMSCWLIHDEQAAANLQPLDGVDHYRMVIDCLETTTAPGECTNVFTETANAHLLGGTALVPPTSKAQCEAACLMNDFCYGYDHNNGTMSCWLHVDPAMKGTQEPLQGVNSYLLDKHCTTMTMTTTAAAGETTTVGCVQTFVKTALHHALGGVWLPSSGSLTSCQMACLSDAACKGFDHNNGTQSCWLLYDEGAFSNLQPLQGVDNYKMVTDCTGAITTTQCLDTFSMSAGHHANGGVIQPAATSLEACKQTCLDNPICVGVDWNNGSLQCWSHQNAATIVFLFPLAGVDNYLLHRCGAPVISTISTTPIPDPTDPTCVEDFIETTNSHGLGGTPNQAAKTLADCQTACRLMVGCQSVDFEPSSLGCWSHMSAITLYPMTGTYNYRLTNNCAGSTTTVPSV